MIRIRSAAALALVTLGGTTSLAAGTPLAQMAQRCPLAATTLLLTMPGAALLGLLAYRAGAGILRLVGLSAAILIVASSAAIYAFWSWTINNPQGWTQLKDHISQGLLPAAGILAVLAWTSLGHAAKPKSQDSAGR